jgi:hypothetical protein
MQLTAIMVNFYSYDTVEAYRQVIAAYCTPATACQCVWGTSVQHQRSGAEEAR